MSDVVVTVPKGLWGDWLHEGELPGQDEWACFFCIDGAWGWDGRPCPAGCDAGVGRPGQAEWDFYLGGQPPDIRPGERVYIVAHGQLRGYAPLTAIRMTGGRGYALVRGGGGTAVTIPEPIRGFQGFRYRWWDREAEVPFPEFATAGVA